MRLRTKLIIAELVGQLWPGRFGMAMPNKSAQYRSKCLRLIALFFLSQVTQLMKMQAARQVLGDAIKTQYANAEVMRAAIDVAHKAAFLSSHP